MRCCIVLPRDTGMAEIPYEDQSLWKWGCSYLSTESLIHSVFQARWSLALITIMSPAPALSLPLVQKTLSQLLTHSEVELHTFYLVSDREDNTLSSSSLPFLRSLYSSIPILWSWELSHNVSMTAISKHVRFSNFSSLIPILCTFHRDI